jgi:hypothetical protein
VCERTVRLMSEDGVLERGWWHDVATTADVNDTLFHTSDETSVLDSQQRPSLDHASSPASATYGTRGTMPLNPHRT